MRGAETVVRAFASLGKARNAAPVTQTRHCLTAPGENLVCVGLMPHVPDDGVFRRIKDIMNRHREFHGTQGTGEMPPGFGDAFDHELADFMRKNRQRLLRKGSQILRIIHAFQKLKTGLRRFIRHQNVLPTM